MKDIVPEQQMAARLLPAEWLIGGGAAVDAVPDLKAVIASNRNFQEVEDRARVLLAGLSLPGL